LVLRSENIYQCMSLCDKQIFESVYLELSEPLQRFMQAKGLAKEASLDIVQESFIRLWNNCAKVLRAKSKSYLYTTANHIVIDEHRKAKTALKYKKQLSSSRVEREDGQYLLETSEFKNRLEAAIDSIPAGAKEVFMMSRFDDRSYREMASLLGLSVKAIEKRMSIALKYLAEKDLNIKKQGTTK